MDRIQRFYCFDRRRDIDPQLKSNALLDKKTLNSYIDNSTANIVLYDYMYILSRESLGMSIINQISFVIRKAKDNTGQDFKSLRQSIDLVFDSWVISQRVAVKVIKL